MEEAPCPPRWCYPMELVYRNCHKTLPPRSFLCRTNRNAWQREGWTAQCHRVLPPGLEEEAPCLRRWCSQTEMVCRKRHKTLPPRGFPCHTNHNAWQREGWTAQSHRALPPWLDKNSGSRAAVKAGFPEVLPAGRIGIPGINEPKTPHESVTQLVLQLR